MGKELEVRDLKVKNDAKIKDDLDVDGHLKVEGSLNFGRRTYTQVPKTLPRFSLPPLFRAILFSCRPPGSGRRPPG